MPLPPKLSANARSNWSGAKTDDSATPYPIPNVNYALQLVRVLSRKSGNKANPKTFGRTFWIAEWKIVRSNSSDPSHRAGCIVSTIAFDNNEFQQKDFSRGLAAAYANLFGEMPSEWSGGHMEWATGPVLDENDRPTGAPDGTVMAGACVTLITGAKRATKPDKDGKVSDTVYTTYRYVPGHAEAERTVAAPPAPPAPTKPVKKTGQEYSEKYNCWINYDEMLHFDATTKEWLDIPSNWTV